MFEKHKFFQFSESFLKCLKIFVFTKPFLIIVRLRYLMPFQWFLQYLFSSNLENMFDNLAVLYIHSILFHLEFQEVEIFYITKNLEHKKVREKYKSIYLIYFGIAGQERFFRQHFSENASKRPNVYEICFCLELTKI